MPFTTDRWQLTTDQPQNEPKRTQGNTPMALSRTHFLPLHPLAQDDQTNPRHRRATLARQGRLDRISSMSEIVLATLNAKYIHAAFGLRCLLANLGELRERATILEFEIAQRPIDIAEAILAQNPRIVGLGIHIWNAGPSTELAAILKRLRPDLVLVLGGPEVSHETDQQEITRYADYVIAGEGDLAFAELCGRVFAGRPPAQKLIAAEPPDFDRLTLPYDLYDSKDIAHRIVYVEASRGCPFRCEFCLSSLDVQVRNVPLERFLPAMQSLLDRGVRHFKFVDRTFNLNLNIGMAILSFFLERYTPGLFLHFEMIPDRLPETLRELIERFPAGSLQFEVGVQTFNPDVAELISRRQDNARVEENLRFLREHTGVHVHADLIAGLPGEDLPSFAAGFDRLVGLRPQEIQLGILKRLRGAPIARHDQTWGMVYSPHPPYEILQNRLIDFPTMQRIRRMARYWDIVANSGNFAATTRMLWKSDSPFWSFLRFSNWLYERTSRTHGIALHVLAELIWQYLTRECARDPKAVADAMWADYQRNGRKDVPGFLRGQVAGTMAFRPRLPTGLTRQARHREL